MSDHVRVDPRRRARAVLIALFVVYLVLLTWIIVWKLAVPWIGGAAFLPHPIKLIPFVPDGEAEASKPLELAANLLLFIPFGLYLGLLAPSWQWWKGAGVMVGASLAFETAQLLLSTGSFDTTDVIMNTAGGLIGLGLIALLRRRPGERSIVRVTVICAIGTVLALLAIVIFLGSGLRYAPQRDVIVSTPTASP
jgi:glycopeptide antibiotics resistance protein